MDKYVRNKKISEAWAMYVFFAICFVMICLALEGLTRDKGYGLITLFVGVVVFMFAGAIICWVEMRIDEKTCLSAQEILKEAEQ